MDWVMGDDLEKGPEGEEVEELTVKVDGKDEDCDHGVRRELMEAEFPSICPKIKMVHKLVPQPDLVWIKNFKEFDKSESSKLQDHLAKFNGIMPSDAVG